MARATAALLPSNNSRHRTILRPLAGKEVVAAAAKEDSSNSAMAINVTPVSAVTTVTMDAAGAISADAADSVHRTDHAAAEVVAAEEDKSRHLAHQSLP
jgi:hypothetical protein